MTYRACRLKKKAQHEANKIKLYGLEQEHKGMISMLEDARAMLMRKVEEGGGGGAHSPPNMHIQSSSPSNTAVFNIEKLVKMRNSKCTRYFTPGNYGSH